MDRNIVSLFNDLSCEFLKNAYNIQGNKRAKVEEAEIKAVSRKGYDLIRYYKDKPVSRYGVDWGPAIHITDFCYKLEEINEVKGSEVLLKSIQEIENGNFANTREILQFILQLKGPHQERPIVEKHSFSCTGSDYFFRDVQPFELLPKGITAPDILPENKPTIWQVPGLLHSFIEKKPANDSVHHNKERQFDLKYFAGVEDFPVAPAKNCPVARGDLEKKLVIVASNVKESTDVWENLLEQDSDVESNQIQTTAFTDGYAKQVGRNQHFDFLGQSAAREKNKKKPQMSCCGLLLDLYANEAKALKILQPDIVVAPPYVLDLQDFVRQLKYVLIGVESASFILDEGQFRLKDGACLLTMQPHTLRGFSHDFALAGSCFVKVAEVCEEGMRAELAAFGTVYKTLWKNILDYLHEHCEQVSSISVNIGLLGLKSATSHLCSAITTIYQLFASGMPVPIGGELLTYLFTGCLQIRQQYVKNVLLKFLYNCCSVYISKAIQVWIFEGKLAAACLVDFFVAVKPSVYMNRSYYARISASHSQVPAFLQLLSDRILACGRAVHLLKLFNRDNKFSRLLEAKQYPKMELCFTKDGLDKLVVAFEEYERIITNLNGEKISFATIFERDRKITDERNLKIKQLLFETMLQRDLERSKRLEKERRCKEERNRLFNEQLAIHDQLKKQRKQREIEEDRKLQEEIDKIAENDKLLEEKSKQATKEYYNELLSSAKKQKEKAMWREKRLQNVAKRSAFLENAINDNNELDSEGNIISSSQDENKNVEEQSAAAPNEGTERTKEIYEVARMEAENNKHKVMNSDYVVGHPNGDNAPTETFDGICNENKILNSGDAEVITLGEAMVVDEVQEEKTHQNTFTEAKRNKAKMMSCEINEDESRFLTREHPQQLTEAMKNKLKILGTEYNLPICEILLRKEPREVTEAMRNKMKILGMEYETGTVTEDIPDESPKLLTEAMRNKMKILGTEYGFDDNSNVADERPTDNTAAVKNKMKILGTEIGRQSQDRIHEVSSRPLTEAEKNKIKVMGVEYNLPLAEKHEQVFEVTDRQRIKEKILGTELGSEAYADLGEVLGTKIYSNKTDTAIDIPSNETEPTELAPNDKIPQKVSSMFSKVSELPQDFSRSMLFPSIEQSLPVEREIDFSDITIEEFELYLKRSIDVALRTQERLANAEVLKLFIQEHNFMSHVFSLRCYFLLYDGEFCRSLTNNLMRSLSSSMKPKHFFESNSLSTIVNEAVAYSVHSCSINASHLSFQILDMPRTLNLESHDLLAPFQLSYKVEWPVNIILTEATLARYRQVFHTFLKLKRLHWCLNESFLLLVTQSRDSTLNGLLLRNSPHYTKLAIYRHAMLLFVMTLQEHMCSNGPYEAWEEFVSQLRCVENLEQLYSTHVHYLKDVLKRCFLVKNCQDLLGYIHNLVEIGLKFHYTLKLSSWHLIDNKVYVHPDYPELKNRFIKFCEVTKNFQSLLRKRVQQTDMRCHQSLLDLLDVKIKIES